MIQHIFLAFVGAVVLSSCSVLSVPLSDSPQAGHHAVKRDVYSDVVVDGVAFGEIFNPYIGQDYKNPLTVKHRVYEMKDGRREGMDKAIVGTSDKYRELLRIGMGLMPGGLDERRDWPKHDGFLGETRSLDEDNLDFNEKIDLEDYIRELSDFATLVRSKRSAKMESDEKNFNTEDSTKLLDHQTVDETIMASQNLRESPLKGGNATATSQSLDMAPDMATKAPLDPAHMVPESNYAVSTARPKPVSTEGLSESNSMRLYAQSVARDVTSSEADNDEKHTSFGFVNETDINIMEIFSEHPEEIVWTEPIMHPDCWLEAMMSKDFSPSCQISGHYTPKQCYLERCWCVDKTGRQREQKPKNRFFYKLAGLTLICQPNV